MEIQQTQPLQDRLEWTYQRIHRFAIYKGVLEDEIGEAFLKLLSRAARQSRRGPAATGDPATGGHPGADNDPTTDDDPDALVAAHARLFELLVSQVELGRLHPVGDAWQNHVLDRILADENTFSRKAETASLDSMGASLLDQVAVELRILQELFNFNGPAWVATMAELLPPELGPWIDWSRLNPRRREEPAPRVRVKQALADAQDWGDQIRTLAQHYSSAGTGLFGRHTAFYWTSNGHGGRMAPVLAPDDIRFAHLPGYEREQGLVIKNTERFLQGQPAANVLLYGPSGTGKSSTVKALLNEFADQGLRLVEVQRSHLEHLPEILQPLGYRANRFLLFLDDLSFDGHDPQYKNLKAILEGSTMTLPANVRVYATSNRRHLVAEYLLDRGTSPLEELHSWDASEEKLSLAQRFGLRVTFVPPDQRKYLEMVTGLARRAGITLPAEELEQRALTWERQHGGRSGRVVRRFIEELVSEGGSAGE